MNIETIEELEELFILFKGLKSLKDIQDKIKKKRSCAVRKINRTRHRLGYFKVTFTEIKNCDEQQFFIHTRMTRGIFEMLLGLVRPQMMENSRNLLSCEFCLALTLLLFLSKHGLELENREETFRLIVYVTYDAIWTALCGFYVTEPSLHNMDTIATDFMQLCDFPNCIGAIDGKHIAVQCPPDTGSQFYNYKGFYSIVLMAACDARYGSRWRILLTTLNMLLDNTQKIVCACVVLHNFLRLNNETKNLYSPPKFVDWEDVNHNIQSGMWRQEVNDYLQPIQPSRNVHVLGGRNALEIRNIICNYINNEGRLNWMD